MQAILLKSCVNLALSHQSLTLRAVHPGPGVFVHRGIGARWTDGPLIYPNHSLSVEWA
jgi:hypothetical protein